MRGELGPSLLASVVAPAFRGALAQPLLAGKLSDLMNSFLFFGGKSGISPDSAPLYPCGKFIFHRHTHSSPSLHSRTFGSLTPGKYPSLLSLFPSIWEPKKNDPNLNDRLKAVPVINPREEKGRSYIWKRDCQKEPKHQIRKPGKEPKFPFRFSTTAPIHIFIFL